MDSAQATLVVEIKLSTVKAMKECLLCGFTTDESTVVCPEDGSALSTRRPDPLIGKTLLERFEILSLIGSGGMGNVYKARQAVAERMVAVKVLHSERLHKQSSVMRFRQEAKAAGSLSHPNIVSFIDFGLTEDHVPFIVMDYVEGTALDEVLRNGTLSIARCVDVFAQACDALEHAHKKGVIHRDIKPSNLMLVQNSDGTEVLKILDFGIAKLLPQDAENTPERAILTMTGELFGSPQYMSPEQCAGRNLDARSDMYSLGCVMYESLLGRAPIHGESVLDIIYKHTHERPAAFKQVRPDLEIPEQLEAVVLKTLEKEPEGRFPSMAALKRNLEFAPRFAEESKNNPQPEPPKPRPTHYKIAGAMGICVVLGAGVAGIASLEFLTDHGTALKWYQLRLWANETFTPQDLRQKTHFLVKLRDISTENKDLAAAYKYGDLAVNSAPNPVSSAFRSVELADTLSQANDKRASQFYAQALLKLRGVAEKNRHAKKWTDNLNPEEPIDDNILRLHQKLKLNITADTATDMLNIANDTYHAGSAEQAEPLYAKVLSQHHKLSKEQQVALADNLALMAEMEYAKNRLEQAESFYKQAIELKTKALGQSQQIADLQRDLGLLYVKSTRYTAAEAMLLDALANSQAASGEHSAASVQLLKDLSKLYLDMKEFSKAESMVKLADQLAPAR